MAELLVKLQELKRLPSELHWFCQSDDGLPRTAHTGEAGGQSAKEDSTPVKANDTTSESVEYRQRLVTDCLQLFAYNGEDVLPYQEFLKQEIDWQLGKCDTCIVQYYKAKHRAIQSLRLKILETNSSEYKEEDVSALTRIFDNLDIDRIKRGLDNAAEALRAADSRDRGKDVLELASQLSLFEALSCQAFLADASLMRDHLDEPFSLIQTNKRLVLAQYVPAATIFLFDPSHERCSWAIQTWLKYPSPITKDDFDFAVRDPLLYNLKVASEPIADFGFIQRLWFGVRKIIDKLDNELITHSLRAMEVDVFRIALEHLQYNTAGLRFIMQTMQKLLEVAPKDYWESMGAISPTTVIEQVFNNPYYDKFVEEARSQENFETSALKDILSWIKPFMGSLQTGHQAQACRSLAFQLMDRLQAERFPIDARVECYRTGLGVLSWTLGNCNKEDMMLRPVGRIVAAETLEVTSTYIKRILDIPTLPTNDDGYAMLTEHCLRAVKVALALECKSIRMDQETLKQRKETQPGFCSYSPAIWNAVVSHLDRGNVIVARAALTGINDLTGLEKFKINTGESHAKEKSAFNITFGNLTHLVCQMLERINDFNPADLDTLFHHSDTATALVAALFSPDASTYEAGVNLIKSISSASARKEAIGHLLLPFFATTLNSFSWAARRIAQNRSFASCPRMLKTCTDVLDILCDSQDGLLRTRALSSPPEVKAIENFWEYQWLALRVIYETTEEWGKLRVADSSVMKEFCRDTMQFSERFFDQYSVFASALDSGGINKGETGASKASDNSAGKDLLRYPARTMEAMVKWLRLRDLYLASTSVKLIKKVLDRLSEWGMTLAEDACKFLEQIIQNGPQARTHLTPQEKAELARALEANLGRSIPTADEIESSSEALRSQSLLMAGEGRPVEERKKTRISTIDLTAWKAKAKQSRIDAKLSDDDEFGDSDIVDEEILSASRSVELLEEQQAARSSSRGINTQAQPSKSFGLKTNLRTVTDAKSDDQILADQATFREKREKEREAKKKRDADALAIVKKRIADKNAPRVAGEGSALSSIGLKGKDHAPKISSMMVSSGSESDSDDELDSELFGGTSKPSKISDAVRDYEMMKLKQAKEQRPIKKMRQVRSAKDMRARLSPDLTSLHKTILGWDFFHTGDFPPRSDREDYSLVSSTFRTPVDYQHTFEPLLILEAWQGFLKSKEEGNFKSFEMKIANRLTVDSFIELSTTMQMAQRKELGVGEADVVLLSKAQSPTAGASQPHCFARVSKISRKKNSMEVDVTYRVNVGNSLIAAMVPNATIFAAKVSSLTTLEREYGALLGLQYFDLCDEVIKARPSPLLKYSENQLAPLMANYNINSAQAKAVRSAIDNDAFTLIQGPPGSGKTKTIVAIVGALMTGNFGVKGVPVTRPQSTEQRPQNLSASKKLLVCAPSNAAVDELVMRFKEGVKTVSGESGKLSVVRLGRSDAMNANVLDVTLEELVNAKLNLASGKQNGPGDETHKLMMAHKTACEELNALRIKVDETKASGKPAVPEQQRDFEVLKRKKQQLSNQIDSARDRGDMVARDAEINRRRIQQEILDGAQVICATLSGSGHEMFHNLNIEFETVIIDEAAQSIELSALIPLKYGCSKCILVGDPKQLPPTVLSREAARFQYEQSLFVRMQANHPNDVHLLDTQYRMHPDISAFPSKAFYDGRLLDGPNMAKLRTQPWHKSKLLGAYRFFDVRGSHQSVQGGHSLTNFEEIEVCLNLFHRLTTDCKTYDFKGKIGIITPYKSQLRELRSRFAQKYGESIFTIVEFNTADAFQGRECEVIMFSCVRASMSKGIGFLSDIRRMNVGITRAKSSLWVLGNSQSLMQGEFWGKLIQDARNRDRYTDGDLITLLSKPLLEITSSVSATRRGSSTSTTLKADADIEMSNTPLVGGFTGSLGLSAKSSLDGRNMQDTSLSSLSMKSVPRGPKSDSKLPSYNPSGGGNGLNSNMNCSRCGSFAHQSSNCDKDVTVTNRCNRCGGDNHLVSYCNVERCFDCGEFGHSAMTCTSTQPLSKQERDHIRRKESDHKITLRRASETRRLKQLGDHAKAVPTVRATSKTPPPSPHQAATKRKREPSPGADGSRAPRNATVQSNQSARSNQSQGNDIPRRPNADRQQHTVGFTDRRLSLNGNEAPGQQSGNSSAGAEPSRVFAAKENTKPKTEDAEAKALQPSISLDGAEENQNGPSKPRPSGPSFQPPNHVRPPVKKRKEVNPFIVPKKKQPRT